MFKVVSRETMDDGGKAVGPLGYSVGLRNDQSFTDASHYRKAYGP
jgi:hypothetical protein